MSVDGLSDLDGDMAAFGRKFHGVGQQIDEDLFQAASVDVQVENFLAVA